MKIALPSLPERLAQAFVLGEPLDPPLAQEPENQEAAYVVQARILDLLNESIAGWKVGTAPDSTPVWGSPLPNRCIRMSPAQLSWPSKAVCGLELEIAFRFSRAFPIETLPESDDEILASLESMAVAIEIVSSRYSGWPEMPDLLKLADLQNHGVLILGGAVPYRADFPFLSPRGTLRAGGVDVSKQPPANPAGDPRHLLAPFVRQCAARDLPVEAGHWITTGSYSGIHFVNPAAEVVGILESLPPVHLSIA